MLPLVLAARAAGHDVVVATGADMVGRLAGQLGGQLGGHGVTTWAVGPTHREAGGGPGTNWLTYFADTARSRAADLVPLAVDWKPDLVVSEDTELSGPVAAAVTGARHVVHGIGIMPPIQLWGALGPILDDLFAQFGTSGDHRAATYLELCPPSLRRAAGSVAGPATGSAPERIWPDAVPLRPVAGTPGPGERLPDAVDALPFERTVHVTLGTVFHDNRNVLHTAIAALSALSALPVNVVATVGPDVDPAGFGRQPAHVLLAPYLPHTLLLPRCAAVVSQGGAGIMFGAFTNGLPHLVLPQGGDQFMNAEAIELAGAGLALHPAEVTGATVTDGVTRLLEEDSFATAAAAVRAELAAMPDAATVLNTLHRAP
ncbi:glycosyltransferase [Dactylosporangium siamense]|uniref:Glycosyl transferase n=2 Tax=Dactylosporangium siamense TaxID=685454 RepID=A0A919UDF6_9ACTN|nr:glycosyl transferase [Dactylosporangium siamense]